MTSRGAILAAFGLLVLALATVLVAPRLLPGLRAPRALPAERLPSLAGLAWLDAPPTFADSLAGHPVAIVVFSDTDPRALAALPAVDAWHRAYAPLGARVAAVHAPAFAFAADSAVAGRLARRLGLALPIALDPALRVAGAWDAASAPRAIVADAAGHVVLDTADALDAAGRALRALVAAGARVPLSPEAAAPEAGAVRWVTLGATSVAGGPLRGVPAGETRVFAAPIRLEVAGRRDTPYPSGAWTSGPDGVTAARGGPANLLAIRYSAARAGAVLSPPPHGPARVWILRDDRWPDPSRRGDDVSTDGARAWVDVTEPRLYWLDRGGGERTLTLSPDQPGVTVHAFVLEDAPR